MNSNHETLINNLTLVMWRSGHLGAFFMQLLESENFKLHSVMPNKKLKNTEWENWDRTFEFIHFELDSMFYKLNFSNDIISFLKEKYKDDEYNKAFIYTMFQLIETLLQENKQILPPTYLNLSKEYLFKLSELPPIFDVDNIKFSHLKIHPASKNKPIVKNLNWKNKLCCLLPPDKEWLGELLLFYKKHYFKLQNPDCSLGERDNSSVWELNFLNFGKRVRTSTDGYTVINIYDLIFNQNIKQLQQIYPNFKLTDTRLAMLATVKQDIIDICHTFGLDHSISYIPKRDDIGVLHTPIICDIIKKIRPI